MKGIWIFLATAAVVGVGLLWGPEKSLGVAGMMLGARLMFFKAVK